MEDNQPLNQLLNVYSTLMTQKPIKPEHEEGNNTTQPIGHETPLPGKEVTGLHPAIATSTPVQPRKSNPTPPIPITPTPKQPLKRKMHQPTQTKPQTKHKKFKRFAWSDALHRQFLASVFDIGLRHAKPKSLLESLQPAPNGLTTEHIKSHLQKYRANSKKSREIFLKQFDIAREQTIKSYQGKALNPGFHAYPLPAGDFPIEDIPDSPALPPQPQVPQKPNVPPQQFHTHKLTPMQNGASSEGQRDVLPGLQTEESLAKRMQVQMQMSKTIQMQHLFQHRRDVSDATSLDALEKLPGGLDTFDQSAMPSFDGQDFFLPQYFLHDDASHVGFGDLNNEENGSEQDLFDFLQ